MIRPSNPIVLVLITLGAACSGAPSDHEASSEGALGTQQEFWDCYNGAWVAGASPPVLRQPTADELLRARDLEGLWTWSSADIPSLSRSQMKVTIDPGSSPATITIQSKRLGDASAYAPLFKGYPATSIVCHFAHKTSMFDARYNLWDRDTNQVINGKAQGPAAPAPPTGAFHIGPAYDGSEVRAKSGFYFVKSDHDASNDWYMIDALQYRRLVDYYAHRR